ncbi:MAG: hypothetical protein DI526_11215 [Caulobacter segnis]|uniref:Uncharacterized protein n=2 Tax=Caulobacter segnis TaxID=88688 RepID=A0A2W5VFN2_9CAUL|nr:MAG: hypothetical protein DI526_11215 [Caulobacter segnis]
MTEHRPMKIVEIVIGIEGPRYNFLNYADPTDPKRLKLDLSERCELFFRYTDELMNEGWRFQARPIRIADDYGVNFSSYMWVDVLPDETELPPRSAFKIIYECNRMGIYTYSLFMLDPLGQKIDLDPDIENGTGRIP